jgi:D-aminopeptidase
MCIMSVYVWRSLYDGAHATGIDNVVLGMPHRGRFNLLVALLDYPARLVPSNPHHPILPSSLPSCLFLLVSVISYHLI